MRTVDFDTPNKALQVIIFPLLRNGKTAADCALGGKSAPGGGHQPNAFIQPVPSTLGL
jgi:hypothetical protein